ncbi:hypothetical protein HD806DRAFT_545133 [Xylariaceae sp. AK1471]|nr:hypothetical protein HD806DRAFT_545133 [Xylariaceae sp. AK1471]
MPSRHRKTRPSADQSRRRSSHSDGSSNDHRRAGKTQDSQPSDVIYDVDEDNGGLRSSSALDTSTHAPSSKFTWRTHQYVPPRPITSYGSSYAIPPQSPCTSGDESHAKGKSRAKDKRLDQNSGFGSELSITEDDFIDVVKLLQEKIFEIITRNFWLKDPGVISLDFSWSEIDMRNFPGTHRLVKFTQEEKEEKVYTPALEIDLPRSYNGIYTVLSDNCTFYSIDAYQRLSEFHDGCRSAIRDFRELRCSKLLDYSKSRVWNSFSFVIYVGRDSVSRQTKFISDPGAISYCGKLYEVCLPKEEKHRGID